MDETTGKCGCGSIEFSFNGEPINSVFCYCKECQKTTSSDKWFGLWIPIDKFNFTKGTPSIFTRIGDSGKEVNIHFCKDCGTTVCAEVTVGNFYSVAVSALPENSKYKPKMSIYTASAPEWAVFPKDVPKFDILPPGMGG